MGYFRDLHMNPDGSCISCNTQQLKFENYTGCLCSIIDDAGAEGYREGIAWERKRIEIEWQIERFECQCEAPMDHLLERIEGDCQKDNETVVLLTDGEK